MEKRVVLIGGGGHASDILAAYEALVRESGKPNPVIGIVDDEPLNVRRFAHRGVRQLGSIDDLGSIDATHYVLALGWPKSRRAVAHRIAGIALKPDTVIHPRAYVPPGVTIGEGTVILACCVVSELATIGVHVYLAHGVLIGHDTEIGGYASIMPGASISGDCSVGAGALIGCNATIIEGLSVGARTTLGAGSVLTKDAPPGVVAVGSPSRWKEAAPAVA